MEAAQARKNTEGTPHAGVSPSARKWRATKVSSPMSHYNVNASLAKTLIQHLIRFVANSSDVNEATAQILHKILATEISPELVRADVDGVIQSTEKIIGPYELQDFNLFYVTRFDRPLSALLQPRITTPICLCD